MDVTLGYLRESLSNHLENEVCQRICKKMLAKRYVNEEDFVKDLDDNEMSFLNHVLEKEIKYAQNEQDQKRAKELNEVYELLL
ncbi:sigma-G-dependent sporulation-specific acid-soluble spore protein CsgA [Bacillus vallismortis]|uniref:sigma-G-dependent sporulation-specific acid-soluble spore protein CsgA n=1 Tax=Bacillus vallismortis TaxID=72361 RepID=UPI002280985C|nr:sigma-G-dependent sporulation-specific acid-soluble spore protein CsgA [Bacillus vallismortis]MCI4136624.1 sigma-G-dependent sporulation-specific acid-soluble spore protein CsgA [Bacillus vallismortis]MCY7894816.1 sigma-G-dependent sporulation-specific acid-soluble spore protein CsgA [Bacillus vallismortis]